MLFFFFKQKTAYEIKECDWSSDVCSSDLFARSSRSNATARRFPSSFDLALAVRKPPVRDRSSVQLEKHLRRTRLLPSGVAFGESSFRSGKPLRPGPVERLARASELAPVSLSTLAPLRATTAGRRSALRASNAPASAASDVALSRP